MMDGKPIKEELQDKDYVTSAADATRRAKSSNGKERRSPDPDDTRPPSVGGNGVASPTNNGIADSLSPPLGDAGARGSPALHKLRRFLSTLLQFASDISLDAGDRVRTLIHNLLSGAVSIDEFQSSVQESTNYPLRASVPGFLRALLPHAQRDLLALARHAKQTPLQYIRSHEQLVLEAGCGDTGDIFASQPESRRRPADPFYEPGLVANGQASDAEYAPPAKRPLLLNPSPFLYPLPGAHLLEYAPPYQPHAAPEMLTFESRSRDGIAVRDVGSLTAPPAATAAPLAARTDDEWRNINTMLNCILSMVEKTKRALAILQQRGSSTEPPESSDIKRVCGEIMAATVRQTEERVAEVRRRAEDAVNQVKRQALAELQRAAGAAEARAAEPAAAERGRVERLLQDAGRSPPAGECSPPLPPLPPQAAAAAQQNQCWNCGRKAQETCSGCNTARYCGAFCQHKDWENHHQVCCGRDLKPTTTLNTSPPVTQPSKPLPRSTTPITGPAPAERHAIASERIALPADRHPLTERHQLSTESRLSLTTLNNAERMLATSERPLGAGGDRLTLATLSTAQGLIGGIGGKK